MEGSLLLNLQEEFYALHLVEKKVAATLHLSKSFFHVVSLLKWETMPHLRFPLKKQEK